MSKSRNGGVKVATVGSEPGELIRISAKNLGALALATCCLRCMWLKLFLKHRLPFQIFPGIFSSIDAYTKRLVRDWFVEKAKAPRWLSMLGPIMPCDKVPHHSQFQFLDERHNILLTGVPDEIFLAKKACLIADYKTARFTDTQDELLPMYQIQLNGYARIAAACGLPPVKGLYLVYMEPLTNGDCSYAEFCSDGGFAMNFSARVLPIELDPSLVDPLLAKARELYQMPSPPPARPGCKDCALVEELIAAAGAAGR